MHTQNIYAARFDGKYHFLKLPPSAELAYRGTQVLLIGGFGACCQGNICGEVEYQIVNQKLIGLARGGSRIQEEVLRPVQTLSSLTSWQGFYSLLLVCKSRLYGLA